MVLVVVAGEKVEFLILKQSRCDFRQVRVAVDKLGVRCEREPLSIVREQVKCLVLHEES